VISTFSKYDFHGFVSKNPAQSHLSERDRQNVTPIKERWRLVCDKWHRCCFCFSHLAHSLAQLGAIQSSFLDIVKDLVVKNSFTNTAAVLWPVFVSELSVIG
jgi:hypothetical protein